ncbi:MAG: sugar transferase [Candidatus Acidiferrales bacterium]
MIRLLNVHFAGRMILLLISECLLLAFTLLAAVLGSFVLYGDPESIYRHLYKLLVPCALCLLSMYYYDLYESGVLSNARESMPRLIQALGTVCVFTTLLYYVYPVVQLDRTAFLTWIAVSGGILITWRYLFSALVRSSRLTQPTLLVGTGPLADALPRAIARRPELGIVLSGIVGRDRFDSFDLPLSAAEDSDSLATLVESMHVSKIIVTMGDRRGKLPVEKLLKLKARGVEVMDGADAYEAITGRIHLPSLRPSWLLFSDGFRVSGKILLYKRIASILFSTLGLILSFPIMLVVAATIKLDSRGPVLFRQERVGRNGKLFTIFKFRTMYERPLTDGDSRVAQENDPRFTRVGKVLRRMRLDELPQLYNILRGDMYLIGPRPFLPYLEKEFNEKIPFYSYRWNVKPGATGWAQIQRGYCASLEDNADKLSCDLYYIKNISIGLDCIILFQTVKIVLLRRGSR